MQKECLCWSERVHCHLEGGPSPADTETFQANTGTSWTEKSLDRSKEDPLKAKAHKVPSKAEKGPPGRHKALSG